MSIQLRTATMTIAPRVNEGSNGKVYFSTDVMEPVNYNVEFSGDGGHNPKHLEQFYKKAYDDGQSVDIIYTQKKTRFGSSFVVYDIKPVKSFAPNSVPVKP